MQLTTSKKQMKAAVDRLSKSTPEGKKQVWVGDMDSDRLSVKEQKEVTQLQKQSEDAARTYALKRDYPTLMRIPELRNTSEVQRYFWQELTIHDVGEDRVYPDFGELIATSGGVQFSRKTFVWRIKETSVYGANPGDVFYIDPEKGYQEDWVLKKVLAFTPNGDGYIGVLKKDWRGYSLMFPETDVPDMLIEDGGKVVGVVVMQASL